MKNRMSKYLIALIFSFNVVFLFAQSDGNVELSNFKLYPTENIYTFLKLDTRDGTISLVQWSMEDETRFEYYLNMISLVPENEQITNRFLLYPTENRWTFILLDQISGKTWQVQWSTEMDKRLILPIQLEILG